MFFLGRWELQKNWTHQKQVLPKFNSWSSPYFWRLWLNFFFFFKLDFISRRFHIRFMIWLEILKSYSRMAEKLIQSMWKFYNCFNTYVCNQTKQWHSFLTSCGNAKHMVTMKINFGIGWIFKKKSSLCWGWCQNLPMKNLLCKERTTLFWR